MRRTNKTVSSECRPYWNERGLKRTVKFWEWRLQDLHKEMAEKKLSATDLVQASLARIAETDEQIGAFLTVAEEEALQHARNLDERLKDGGERGPLFGLPAGIKDNVMTAGIRTTSASRMLANYTPIYDATVVQKLKQVDAVAVGKLNMDEFGLGGSNENSAFGLVRNPWNRDYVPGGSSGGPAAAVAVGQIYFALASDTGGSIRQPASYCGVVGLRPTYGLVSRYGLAAVASSLDQIGTLTKNVEDAAYVLRSIAGYDEFDSTSSSAEIPDYVSALTGEVRGLRIGFIQPYMEDKIDPGVRTAVEEALGVFERLGARVEEVSLKHAEYGLAAYPIIASAEASSNLARYDGVRYGMRSDDAENLDDLFVQSRSRGFGDEVKRQIILGTYALSSGQYDAYYIKAQKVRTLVRRDFEEAFSRFDVLVSPTTPTPAFPLGSQIDDPLAMYKNEMFTIPVSLAGLPAISVPCGTVNGLPVGLQVIGKALDESTLLKAAHAFEQNTEHHKLRPEL